MLIASSVTVDGIEYRADMVISAGSCSLVSQNSDDITDLWAVNSEILFVCNKCQLGTLSIFGHSNFAGSHVTSLCVIQMSELNEVFPLSCYTVKGRMVVTPKRYILC